LGGRWLPKPVEPIPGIGLKNKNGAGGLHSRNGLEIFMSGISDQLVEQYQAAQRRVFGVRPNQRLQAR
jgi:hypothetical protein